MLEIIESGKIDLNNPVVYMLANKSDLTKSAYLTTLTQVCNILGTDSPGGTPWENLSAEDWFLVRSKLEEQVKTPSTLNKYLGHLRGLVKALFDLGKIDLLTYTRITEKALPRVKSTKVRKVRALTLEEIEALKGVVNSPRDKALLGLLLYCGLRLNEAITLTWERVNLEERYITVLGKGNREDWVPLHDYAIQALEGLPRVTEFVLFSLTKHGTPRGKLSARGAQKIISTWAREAGIPEFTPHDLRRSLGTHVYKSTGKLESAQGVLRHQNLITTQNYIFDIEAEETKREAIDSIEF